MAALLADSNLYRNILSFGSNLRSTPAYWYSQSQKVLDMLKQLKSPSLFFTLSAADLQWKELYRILDPQDELEQIENDSLAYCKRSKLLIENPLIVSWFFHLRSNYFVHEILFPALDVIDYYFRVEFQHRGSPHIHGFIWIRDAPTISDINIATEAEKTRFINYYKNLISVNNIYDPLPTNPPSVNPAKINFIDVDQHYMYSNLNDIHDKYLADYKKCINTFQKHTKCGDHCLRTVKNSNIKRCRYNFPKSLRESSDIIRNPNNNTFELQLQRNDQYMNSHMPFVTSLYRGNTDFQAVLSKETAGYYITKYMTKSEQPSNVFNNIQNLVDSIRSNSSTMSIVQSILCKQCGQRDYSAQECMWIVMGFDYYQSSRSFFTINLSEDSFVPLGAGQNSVARDPELRYANRLNDFNPPAPRGRPSLREGAEEERLIRIQEEVEAVRNMSLFQFYSTYKFNASSNSWSKYILPPILRIFPRPPKQINGINNELYYQLQVKLHIPWVDSIDTLNPHNESWFNLFNLYNQLVPEIWNVDEAQIEEEFEDEPVSDRNSIDLHDWQNYYLLNDDEQRNDQIPETDLGRREQDNINWSESYLNYSNPESLRNFIRDSRANNEQNLEQEEQMNLELSREQQIVMNVIEAIIHFELTGEKLDDYRNSIIVQGCAGSGKSTLIKSIISRLRQAEETEERFGPNSYALLALTGSAASNINGSILP